MVERVFSRRVTIGEDEYADYTIEEYEEGTYSVEVEHKKDRWLVGYHIIDFQLDGAETFDGALVSLKKCHHKLFGGDEQDKQFNETVEGLSEDL